MRTAAFSILLMAVFLLAQSGCTGQVSPAPVDITPEKQPGSVSVPASAAVLSKPAALIIEEHTDKTTASGGSPGTNSVSIIPVSAEDGNPIQGLEPVVLGQGLTYSFSEDRSQMAVLSYSAKDCHRFCLRIIDLASWQDLTGPIELGKNLNAWITLPIFDENSNIIPLLVSGNASDTTEALLVDRSRKEVSVKVLLQSNVYAMAYTPDGNLAVYGTQTDPPNAEMQIYAALLDGNDLQVLWEQTLTEVKLSEGDVTDDSEPLGGVYYDHARIFSPDGSKLFIVAANEPKLVTVDFLARTVQSSTIETKRTWLEKLLTFGVRSAHAKMLNGTAKSGVASQDGRYLFVVGQQSVAAMNDRGEIELTTIPLGLQVIDTTDGTLVQAIETGANHVSLSRDGKTLLLSGWQAGAEGEQSLTEILDLTTWQVVQRLDGMGSASRLLDGSEAWLVTGLNTSSPYTIDLYRPGDTTPTSQITRSVYVDWVIIP